MFDQTLIRICLILGIHRCGNACPDIAVGSLCIHQCLIIVHCHLAGIFQTVIQTSGIGNSASAVRRNHTDGINGILTFIHRLLGQGIDGLGPRHIIQ